MPPRPGSSSPFQVTSDTCLKWFTAILVASSSATFSQSFAKVGLHPDWGGSYFLPRLVGQARAHGLSLLGAALEAQVAAAWGRLWNSVADSEFAAHEPVAEVVGDHIAERPLGRSDDLHVVGAKVSGLPPEPWKYLVDEDASRNVPVGPELDIAEQLVQHGRLGVERPAHDDPARE